jgi:acetyltransferase-like isoleucine patch superfamily enzyme
MSQTPILFLIFNRPEVTVRVFEQIRQIQPAFLFVAADGPRPNKENEANLCLLTRQIVQDGIDWPCEVKYLFRDQNLGCGHAVSSAITWFFEHVEQGIILEDDCLPAVSFFHFASELLEKYRHETSIWHISGSSYSGLQKSESTDADFYFSKLPFIWGWATWRDRWQYYKLNCLKQTPIKIIDRVVKNTFQDRQIADFWVDRFVHARIQPLMFTWDYQWIFTIWNHEGNCILPSKNLISNIGWGADATHTTETNHHLNSIPANDLGFPLKYPEENSIRIDKDSANFNFYFTSKSQLIVPKTKLKTLIHNFIRNQILKFIPEVIWLADNKKDLEFFTSQKNDSIISPNAIVYEPCKLTNVGVDDYTYIAPGSLIVNTEIGKFCSIGPNFRCGYGIHPTNGISTSPMFYSTKKQNGTTLSSTDKIAENLPIHIGNDVFIGINVTVLDGVKIGNGAVIAAGAVVTKDVQDYAIVGGVPAKFLKFRFSDDEIEKMTKINWYNADNNVLYDVEKYFFEIDTFINKII